MPPIRALVYIIDGIGDKSLIVCYFEVKFGIDFLDAFDLEDRLRGIHGIHAALF